MSESNLNSPTVSFVDSTSINKASYLRFNTSSSPLWLKCVQLKDNVYFPGAILILCLNSYLV